jgi:hypothetical protein
VQDYLTYHPLAMVLACIDLGTLSNILVCDNFFLLVVPLADAENQHDFRNNENEGIFAYALYRFVVLV